MDYYFEAMKKQEEEIEWELKIRRIIHEEVMQLPNSPEFSFLVQDIVRKELDYSNIRIEIQNNSEEQIIKQIKKQLRPK